MQSDEMNGAEPKAGMGTGAKVVLGCGITVAVIIILLVGTVVFFGKQIARFATTKVVDMVITQSTLSEAEKEDARATVRRFLKQMQEDNIPEKKVGEIMEILTKGMLGKMVAIGAINHAVQQSDLNAQEKEEAQKAIAQFMAGLSQKKISDSDFQTILDRIPTEANGNLKQPPWTDEQLKGVLAQVDAAIEGKDIEVAEAPPDLADDLRAAIRMMKEAMGEEVEPTPIEN